MTTTNPELFLALTTLPIDVLFDTVDSAQAELRKRGWQYLAAIGYPAYTKTSMGISRIVRSGRTIIRIRAEFEMNYKKELINIDIPVVQFEALAPATAMFVDKLPGDSNDTL